MDEKGAVEEDGADRVAPDRQEYRAACLQRVQGDDPQRVIDEVGQDVGEQHRSGRCPERPDSRGREEAGPGMF